MTVRCSSCSADYPESMFLDDRWILCDCGTPVAMETPEESREKMRALARLADRVCQHILDESYPSCDIAIERSQLREQALDWFPECGELFDMIYGARFDRLWKQWRRCRA